MPPIPFLNVALRVLVVTALAVPTLAQGGGDGLPDGHDATHPIVAFEESSVEIAGATPSGDVVVFGLSREWTGYVHRVLRREVRLQTDATGAVRWELDEPVEPRSVWAAVDVATGSFALAAPDGFEIERVELQAAGLGANARFLEREGRYLDLLLVRPSETLGGGQGGSAEDESGFWGMALRDGGDLDRDGAADSRLSVDVTELTALGDSSAAPERLRPRDVVIGVDPETLRVFATQLATAPDGGATVAAEVLANPDLVAVDEHRRAGER